MADATWRWLPSGLAALARGARLDQAGEARMASDEAGAAIGRPITLPNPRVVELAGGVMGWAFDDLMFGPPVTAEGIRAVVVSVAGADMAVLPFGRAYDVVEGVFTVVVDQEAVLTIRDEG